MTDGVRQAKGRAMKFRILIGVILVAVIAWSGWWWWGAGAKRDAIERWMADRQRDGWVAEAQALTVTGYPNRFDALFRDLALADPAEGWAWEAPAFQILSLAYAPNHVIVTWPSDQVVAIPGERVAIRTAMLRASTVFVPDTGLALDRAVFEVERLTLTGQAGWTAALDRALVSTRRAGAVPLGHDVSLTIEGADLPPALAARLDPAGTLAPRIDRVAMDAMLGFDSPWDRFAVEGRRPALTSLDLRAAEIIWGALRLTATGQVAIDDGGMPEGTITLTARNWRAMVQGAVAAGVIAPDIARAVEAGLELLALLSGDGETLTAPLTLRNGLISLGPVPLGPAPRFTPPLRS